jgi:hypothetical protein
LAPQWNIATPIYVTKLQLPTLDSVGRSSLGKSDRPPKEYVPGTLRSWQGQYYYIPNNYKQKFFELCMLILERPQPPEQKNQPAGQINKLTRQLRARPENNLIPFF